MLFQVYENLSNRLPRRLLNALGRSWPTFSILVGPAAGSVNPANSNRRLSVRSLCIPQRDTAVLAARSVLQYGDSVDS